MAAILSKGGWVKAYKPHLLVLIVMEDRLQFALRILHYTCYLRKWQL